MRHDSPINHEQDGESQEIRRLAAACFLEEIEPGDLRFEDRHLIAVRRELVELRGLSTSEAYLRCLAQLTDGSPQGDEQ